MGLIFILFFSIFASSESEKLSEIEILKFYTPIVGAGVFLNGIFYV